MSEASGYRYARIPGLDVARGLAIIAMIFVNFMHVFSRSHVVDITARAGAVGGYSAVGLLAAGVVLILLAGRAVAQFLVLFGIGLMLGIDRSGRRLGRGVVVPLIRRFLVLVLGGLLLTAVWEAEILHYIGLFGLVAIGLAVLSRRGLILVGGGTILGAEVLRAVFDYRLGWGRAVAGLTYVDMWSVAGQLRQVLFNGFYPVFPWLSFVILGLLLGRLNLTDSRVQKRLVYGSFVAAVLGFVLKGMGVPAEFFPPHTLFVLTGMATATWMIGFSLWFASQEKTARVSSWLANLGRLALTHYVAHILLVILPVGILTGKRRDFSFEVSFAIAAAYVAVIIVFGNLWLRYRDQGPLEWLLRRAAGTRIYRRPDDRASS